MSRLRFEYWTDISYSQLATQCNYTLKCLPQDTDMQKMEELNIEMEPAHTPCKGKDAFGNAILYGDLYQPHDKFSFHITGVAQTECAISEQVKEDEFVGWYRYSNTLNTAGPGLRDYYESLLEAWGREYGRGMQANKEITDYDRAIYFMNALHRDFSYEPGVTHMGTTAEEAWQLGKGVCQDYAHILIGLCHLAGIPARYVTGMMVGEGYSHAWVEILSKGYWYGLDPTNGGVTTGNYIKIAVGRHANDCTINKGIVRGGGAQSQTIRVMVEGIK